MTIISFGQTTTLQQPSSITKEARLYGHIDATQFCDGGKVILAATNSGYLYVWETDTGKLLSYIATSRIDGSHPKLYTGFAITPDGKYVFVAERWVWKWDVVRKKLVQEDVWQSLHSVGRLTLSPDGRLLMVMVASPPYYSEEGGYESVQLIESATGNLVLQSQKRYRDINAAAFSADGKRLALGDENGVVYLFDTNTLREIRRYKSLPERIHSLALSPNGEYLLTSDYNFTACLWQTKTGKMVQQWRGTEEWHLAVTFSPDGRYALIGDKPTLLWEIKARRTVKEFPIKADSAAFSPDGKYLLTGGSDATVRLWDVASGQQRYLFKTERIQAN